MTLPPPRHMSDLKEHVTAIEATLRETSYRTLWVEQFRRRLSMAERLRKVANTLSIIGAVVVLRQRGEAWVGLCPFHEEKTPSFQVREAPNDGNPSWFFHCFGCGAAGDVFKFIEKTRNVDYPEACAILADMLGIALDS